MFSFNYNVVYFTLFYVFRVAYSLVELPAVEDNDIAITETVIRNTVNDLFSTLKVRGSENRPKFKKYSVIHNFFVSITLKDCDTLKKIVKLSQVNNIDNNTQHFIAQINEVFDETDNKSNEATDDIYVNMHIEKFIKKLRNLKQIYQFNKYFSKHDINEKILEHLSRDRTTLADVTNDTNKTNESTATTDNTDDQVWTPVLQSGRRIYHGHRTHITHYPFMASVLFFDKFHCAGSIIKADVVVTAASCLQLAWNNRFFRENPAFLSVQVGSDFYEAGGENIPVLEIYFHFEYDPRTLNNNIALLRLTVHIMFSKVNKKVKRIDFDQFASPLPIDTGGIIIVGWGAKDNTGNLYSPWENRLSYAELDYYPHSECEEIYTKDYVTKKHFCAGFFTKPTGACQHDVGGPGVYRGYLVGVISFGPPICGTPDAPTVFTKVGFYKDWINKIINTPAPYIKPQTTLRVTRNTFRPVYTKKSTTAYLIQPIMAEPGTVLRRESLRMLEDDNLFKEFLSTMFKQKEIIEARQAIEKTAQKDQLRQKLSTKIPATDSDTEIDEPETTTANMSHGYVLDVVANKFLDFMGMKTEPTTMDTTTDTSIIEVFENHVNIEVKKKKFDTYSVEEDSGEATAEYSKLTEAKPTFSTASTYPLFVGIEYNDEYNEMSQSQPTFKASERLKHVLFKADDRSVLDDRNEKINKQKSSKQRANKHKKVIDRTSAVFTRKPESSEYEDVTSDKLVESNNNANNVSELDSLVKDILDYVKEKPTISSKIKKYIQDKNTRSRYATATTSLHKKSVAKDKYNNRLVTKIKTRTTAAADIILSPMKSDYENEDYENDKPKISGTYKSKYSKGFMLKTGKTNLAGNKINKILSQDKFKYSKKAKSRNKTFTRKPVNVKYKDATSTLKKIHKNENIKADFQLDLLVQDIFDFIQLGSIEHNPSKEVISVKKFRNIVSTATTPIYKIKNNYEKGSKKKRAKNEYGHANEGITDDLVSELDISKLEAKKAFVDEVEYENDNSNIDEPKREVSKIFKKSKNKHMSNNYAISETVPKNLGSSKESFKKSRGYAKSHREKPRSSKHLLKVNPKDTTVSTDKIEYEDEDGEPDRKANEVSKYSKNKKSNNDDDTNAEQDGSNDSKLEEDITELLDELDLRKILESAENTVQINDSKKKTIKGKISQTSLPSHSKESSESSEGLPID